MENFYETFFFKSRNQKLIFNSNFERKRTFGIASLNLNRQKRNTFNDDSINLDRIRRYVKSLKHISHAGLINFSLYSKVSNHINFDSISKNSYYSEDDKE